MNKTQKAFNFAGKSGMYDGVITGTGLVGSLVSNVVWKMNKEKDLEYLRGMLQVCKVRELWT